MRMVDGALNVRMQARKEDKKNGKKKNRQLPKKNGKKNGKKKNHLDYSRWFFYVWMDAIMTSTSNSFKRRLGVSMEYW